MRFLALYKEQSLPLLRRVKAPLSVLAQRGYSFSFMQVEQFSMEMTYGADVTLLSNWVFTEEEYMRYVQAVNVGRLFSYDLSDPYLLDVPMVWKTLEWASLVTVPNERLKKQVDILLGQVSVEVTPSCVDIPYFLHANTFPAPKGRFIGCFGDYDWELIREAVAHILTQYPTLTVLADAQAFAVLGGRQGVARVEVTPETYPLLLRSCLFGLCPSEGPSERDDSVRHEYGILCVPTLQLQGKEQQTDQWVQALDQMLSDTALRTSLGATAFALANTQRSTQQAKAWLRTYQKKLPLTLN